MKSITRLLFITMQIAALVWVSISYVIAIYPGWDRAEGGGEHI